MSEVACPTEDAAHLALPGCGSANVVGPDDEGLYDCVECGLWFKDERSRDARTNDAMGDA